MAEPTPLRTSVSTPLLFAKNVPMTNCPGLFPKTRLAEVFVPPVMVSAPFKILLFVLVDGWNLVVGSLLKSFY